MTAADPGSRIYAHTMEDHILATTEVTAIEENFHVTIGTITAVAPALCERAPHHGHVHYRITERGSGRTFTCCGAMDPVVPME